MRQETLVFDDGRPSFATVRLFIFQRGTKRMRISACNEIVAMAIAEINKFRPPYDSVTLAEFGELWVYPHEVNQR